MYSYSLLLLLLLLVPHQRARLGLGKRDVVDHARSMSPMSTSRGIQLTDIRTADQVYMTAEARASAVIPVGHGLTNAVFRKNHNIRWLASQAQTLDPWLAEKRAQDQVKKQASRGKYGFK